MLTILLKLCSAKTFTHLCTDLHFFFLNYDVEDAIVHFKDKQLIAEIYLFL